MPKKHNHKSIAEKFKCNECLMPILHKAAKGANAGQKKLFDKYMPKNKTVLKWAEEYITEFLRLHHLRIFSPPNFELHIKDFAK